MGTPPYRKMVKLYYVSGLRHHAIVLADNKQQAVQQCIDKEEKNQEDPLILYGHVQKWEDPEAEEIQLPKGFAITSKTHKK